jgi:hypothetical protein
MLRQGQGQGQGEGAGACKHTRLGYDLTAFHPQPQPIQLQPRHPLRYRCTIRTAWLVARFSCARQHRCQPFGS